MPPSQLLKWVEAVGQNQFPNQESIDQEIKWQMQNKYRVMRPDQKDLAKFIKAYKEGGISSMHKTLV